MKKLLTGLLGGLALGVLFAPEKGDTLRKKLANSDDKISDLGKELLSAGKDISSEVKKYLESDEVKELFSKGKENLSEVITHGKNLSEKGKAELQDLVQKVKKCSKDHCKGSKCKNEKGLADTLKEKFSGKKEKQETKKEPSDVLDDIKDFFAGEEKK